MEKNVAWVFLVVFPALLSITNIEAKIFDITTFGAKSDGRTDASQAMIKAWNEACINVKDPISNTIVVPKGTFYVNPVVFKGPCKTSVRFQVQGTVIAPEKLEVFKDEGWVKFYQVDRLILEGGGIFDAMGKSSWTQNTCHKTASCTKFPITLMFTDVTNSLIQGVTSKDSKFFHVNVIQSNNITFDHFTISAPDESKNTDGIHIGRSTGIKVINSDIMTGDDCVSLGDGSQKITIKNVNCGPGHGFSIGSLGRYPNEQPVDGVYISDCKLTGTTNGVRIKTWPGSPNGIARDIHFDNIILEDVTYPMVIDQEYCPHANCKQQEAPSKIKLSNISFDNIRGTTPFPTIASFLCSKTFPCEQVKISNIDIKYVGNDGPIISKCSNIRPLFSGKIIPKICA